MTAQSAMQRLASVDQGMIADCMLRLNLDGWIDGLHAAGKAVAFAGPARTLLIGPRRGTGALPMTKYAIMARMRPGEVVVIGGYPTPENQMGDNVARFGQMQGIAAIVCDAPVRDYEGMGALDIPLFCRGRTARMPVTTDIVAMDVPIICAGSQVRPGDVLIGGPDGLLVLPESSVSDVLFQLEDIEQIEQKLQAAIKDGRPLEEIERLASGKKVLRRRSEAA